MNDVTFQVLGIVAATLVTQWVLDRGVRFFVRLKEESLRQDAAKVLKAHGMKEYTYLPSASHEPGELRDALAAFEFTNHIVVDRNGRLVGRVLPKAQSKAQETGPILRLVVDNSNELRQ